MRTRISKAQTLLMALAFAGILLMVTGNWLPWKDLALGMGSFIVIVSFIADRYLVWKKGKKERQEVFYF